MLDGKLVKYLKVLEAPIFAGVQWAGAEYYSPVAAETNLIATLSFISHNKTQRNVEEHRVQVETTKPNLRNAVIWVYYYISAGWFQAA